MNVLESAGNFINLSGAFDPLPLVAGESFVAPSFNPASVNTDPVVSADLQTTSDRSLLESIWDTATSILGRAVGAAKDSVETDVITSAQSGREQVVSGLGGVTFEKAALYAIVVGGIVFALTR